MKHSLTAFPNLWPMETLFCCLCKSQQSGELPGLDRAGWTWFTGHLSERKAICARCQKTRHGDCAREYGMAGVRPRP